MTNKKISIDVLEKIKKEKIEPISKWNFLLKKWVFWMFFGFSVLLGSFAMSVIMFLVRTSDLDVWSRIDGGIFEMIFMVLPYFWIVIFVLFVFVAYLNFKNTDTGYRYRFSLIVVASLIISIVLGSIFMRVGLARWVNQTFVDHLPYYMQISQNQRNMIMWGQIDSGLLGGRILFVEPGGNFELEDFKMQKWSIINENLVLRDGSRIHEDMMIKIIGERQAEGVFKAYELRPFERRFNFIHKNIDYLPMKGFKKQ